MAERTAGRVAFGDVVRLSKERTSGPDAEGFDRYVGLEHIDPGDLRIRRWGDVADGTTFSNVFRPGQVLFGKRRAYQRKVAVADFEGVCSGDIYVLEAKDPSVLLPELLPFICQSDRFFDHAVQTSAGSLSPRTNWASLSAFEFPLPPVEEQRVIAKRVHSLAHAVEAYRDLHGKGRVVVDALVRRLLHEDEFVELVETGRTPQFEGWAVTTIGEVCERITYGFTNPMPTMDEGPWMVTAADVVDGHIDYATARHTSREAFEGKLTAKSRTQPGDVLLTKDGALGRVAVVDRPDVCINQSVAVLRPGHVLPEYLAWVLRSSAMQWRLMHDVGGSAVKHIYITKVADTPLFVPDLEAQRRIVERLQLAEDALSAVANRLSACRALTQFFVARQLGAAS